MPATGRNLRRERDGLVAIFLSASRPLYRRRFKHLARVDLDLQVSRIFSLLQESADGLTTFFRTVQSGGNGKPNFLA